MNKQTDAALVHLSEQAQALNCPSANILHCEVTPHDDEPGALMVLVELDNGETLATTVTDSQPEDMQCQSLWASCVAAVGFGLAMGAP